MESRLGGKRILLNNVQNHFPAFSLSVMMLEMKKIRLVSSTSRGGRERDFQVVREGVSTVTTEGQLPDRARRRRPQNKMTLPHWPREKFAQAAVLDPAAEAAVEATFARANCQRRNANV